MNVPPGPAPPPEDPIDLLWARALESWEDEKIHAAVLELALRTERLPDLAGRYRALSDDPVKGAVAKRRIDALVAAATQLLFAQKSPPPAKSPAWLTALVAVMCLALLSLLTWSIFFRAHLP